jgi:hypothetical protein
MILRFPLQTLFYSRWTSSLEDIIAGSWFIDQANIRTVVRASGRFENLAGFLKYGFCKKLLLYE